MTSQKAMVVAKHVREDLPSYEGLSSFGPVNDILSPLSPPLDADPARSQLTQVNVKKEVLSCTPPDGDLQSSTRSEWSHEPFWRDTGQRRG